jgi:hypothetical protein
MKRPDRFASGKTQKPGRLLNRAACYCRDGRRLIPEKRSVNAFLDFFSTIADRLKRAASLPPFPLADSPLFP